MDISPWIRFVLLVIVIFQLYLGLRLLKANIVDRIYGEIHEIHKIFIQYPMLRPYFFHKVPLTLVESKNREGDNSEEYYRARSIAEMFFDIFEHIYVLRSESSSKLLKHITSPSGDIQDNWDGYIDDMLSSSPFLSSYLLEVEKHIFPPELRTMVKQSINRHWPDIASATNKSNTI